MPPSQVKKDRRSPPSVESRITECYEDLSEIDQRLADVILSAPGQLAMQTATEIAATANVSKATTTRFFQKLGYDSYEDARQLARAAQLSGSPLYLLERGLTSHALDDVLRAHLDNEIANLTKTYRSLNIVQLEEIVDKLATAKRVFLIGYRHSHTVATMFRRELSPIRDNVFVLPLPGETLAEYLGSINPDDMVINIGFRRRVPATGLVAATLAAAGVPTLYLSEVSAGKAARLANWVIRCHTDGFMVFDSTVAVAALVNLICSLVSKRLATQGNKHLKEVEILHQTLKEFE
jgi:DNA-binding MurR/RpiR family transcriptional regulator